MNKSFFSIALAAAAAFAPLQASAQAVTGLNPNEAVLGYTLTDALSEEGGAFGEPGVYPIGAMLEPSQLINYKGCPIVGLRIGLTFDLGRTQTFLSKIEGGILDDIKVQKQRLYKGWNRIDFNGEQYVIKGTESLFFGYDYEETDELNQVAAESGVLGFAPTESTNPNACLVLMNDQLYSMSAPGPLAVQLIIDTSSMPTLNTAFTFVDCGFKYKKIGESVEIYASLQNVGKAPINSVTVGYSSDDAETPVTKTFTFTEPLVLGAQEPVSYSFPAPDAIGSQKVKISVTEINGEPTDLSRENYSTSVSYAVYRNSVPRQKLWMDVFCDQDDPYSGKFGELLEEFKASMDTAPVDPENPVDPDEYVAPGVIIAKAYKETNSLACEGAEMWWNAYNYSSPTFTSNRALFPGEASVAYNANDYLLQLPFIIPALIQDIIAQDIETPSFATINVDTSYDPASRKTSLTVSGELLEEARAILGDVGLTIVLLEDGLTDSQYSIVERDGQYTARNIYSYVHNDVMREYLTAPGGDLLDPESLKFSKNFEFTLPETYVAENVTFAAYISKATEEVNMADIADYDIIQANSAKLYVPAAVGAIGAEEGTPRFFNLNGLEVPADALAPGFYIRRYPSGRADRIVVK